MNCLLQGDIELLQFANKPDLAYDMCTSVAPDCGSFGSYEYSEDTRTNNVYETTPNYHIHIGFSASPTRNVNQHVNEYRYNSANTAVNLSNPWITGGRDLTTVRPYWQIPESQGLSTPHIPTDYGKILYNIVIS